jgi:hypothetical protein
MELDDVEVVALLHDGNLPPYIRLHGVELVDQGGLVGHPELVLAHLFLPLALLRLAGDLFDCLKK